MNNHEPSSIEFENYFRSDSQNDDFSEIDNRFEKINISDSTKKNISFPCSKNYCKKDFVVVEMCGHGAYATVNKVLHLKTGEYKAIKIIDKTFIQRENKLYQIYLENEILQRIQHPNIINLDGVFEESKMIYMVLEYLPNGDFYEFLKNNSPLKYDTAQYYVGQLVNALEYLHKNGISHRDLKPENLMLDDFATCKISGKFFDKNTMRFIDENEVISKDDESDEDDDRKNKHTFVGTAEYVSPEVLMDKGAGSAADLWALGCIVYQMFTGFSPFKSKTEYFIFQKILKLDYTFPDDFPEEVKSLIRSLLIIDPSRRLGAGTDDNNFNNLKLHSFFKGLNFSNLNDCEPPHKNNFKINDKKTQREKNNIHSEELNNGISKHKNTITILKSDVIEKKSPWFHYNTRKVVLDNTPKIEYIDPEKNIVKGVIYLTRECYAKFIDNNIFELFTPKRTFKFRTETYESGVWSKIINETIEKYCKS